MGNNIPSNGNIKVGSNTTIEFKRRTSIGKTDYSEEWKATYIIDRPKVLLKFTKRFDNNGTLLDLRLQIHDTRCKGVIIILFIDKAENDLLKKMDFTSICGLKDIKFDSETYDTWGFVTKTNVFFHGNGRGLFVVEQKSMHRGMNPYNVRVSHYYAVCENDSSGNKIDIGLSMVADFSVSNNKFVFSFEGPVQHPSSMICMFQQVARTRVWKPATCVETQRQVCNGVYEIEFDHESDRNEDRINFPQTQICYNTRQSGRSVIANQGAVRGNYNGNYVTYNQYIFGRE